MGRGEKRDGLGDAAKIHAPKIRLSIAVTQEEAQFRLQIFKFRRWLQAAEGPEGALGGRVRREAHELLKRAEKGLRSLRGGGK